MYTHLVVQLNGENKLEQEKLSKLATTIRMLAVDGVEKANSGHPGMPMGMADVAAVLWSEFLNFSPSDPAWANRDRFVLSAGHGSMLLYSLLNLFGFALPMTELENFRQWESKTPGHPEFGLTPGVETTTGPLGQGFANGVGLALSSKLLAQSYSSELFNNKVYAIVSDGDLMEGVSAEAASLAGHLKLDNLIYFYDDNEISIGGDTDVCFTESVPKRFEAYGWAVQEINGHDYKEIAESIKKAKHEKNKPSLIVCKTTIGLGSPNKAGKEEVHGAPLGKEERKLTREKLGWPEKDFFIPEDVKAFCMACVEEKQKTYANWQEAFSAWKTKSPEKEKIFAAQSKREIPQALEAALIEAFKDDKKDATRNLSGKAIQVIAKHIPYFIGGSADLEPSTKTLIKDSPDIAANSFAGRNIRFGVREHAMGALVNGLAYEQKWFPYTATFLVFADYMRPTIRLAAISHLQSLFIFTHDSFWVGEDGPTHQPIEQIASLRAIPNVHVFRPADGLETALCYFQALKIKNAPSCLLFTRQNVPPLAKPTGFSSKDIERGAYAIYGNSEANLVLVATGSEVWVAIEAAKILETEGKKVKVVSMPCVELFLKQPQAFREELIPSKAKKVSIEAASTFGWERVVGSDSIRIGIDHFGASAPGELLAEKFGFTPQTVVERVKAS